MTTGFVLLFIAWAVSTCCNIFLLWYLQKVLRNNDKVNGYEDMDSDILPQQAGNETEEMVR